MPDLPVRYVRVYGPDNPPPAWDPMLEAPKVVANRVILTGRIIEIGDPDA